MAQLIKNLTELRKRVKHFLGSSAFGRQEVKGLFDSITPYGSIALFGGMLRDLSIVGNKGFNSDIDVVVDSNNVEEFERVLESFSCSRNKFGGYRLSLSKWNVDIWLLETTWAFKQGHVHGGSFSELCKTTFFDWDAVVYEVDSEKITAIDGYVDKINSGVIDINLEINPNPIGNIVKAFRYQQKYNASFSNRLARYIVRHLKEITAEQLTRYETISHSWPILNTKELSYSMYELRMHQERHPLLPFKSADPQHSLIKY
jgi:hypothetical protein